MDPKRIVARYKRSETLTKEWIMGIRRTWLKLNDPPIGDWDDVHKAYRNLALFVDRLKDQILYARRGPYTGTPTMSEGQKVLKLLGQIASALSDVMWKAKHWQSVQEQNGLPGFDQADGEKMLNLYRTDFPAASDFALETSPGKWRNTTFTELMDKILKLLREDAQRIKRHNEQHPDDPYDDRVVYREFDLHGMKIVMDDKLLLPSEINDYINIFDETYAKMKAKGFGKAWYGTIFVQCESCGGENPLGKNYGVGGDYRVGPDTVQVYSRPGRGVVRLVAHELGHRFWYKQMSQAQRAKFESLVRVHKTPRPQDPEKLKEWEDELEQDARPIFPVSEYGGGNTSEAFAEVFADYVMGKDMTRDQLESFKEVVSSMSKMRRLIRRYARALATPADVERFRKDLRIMTKIYKSIGMEEDERTLELWEEGHRLFRKFRENFERWVYKIVIPLTEDETYTQKQIRKEAWDALFTISLDTLFPTRWAGEGLKRAPQPSELRHVRDRNIARYQKAFSKALKTIEDYLEGGGSTSQFADEKYEVAGMNVLIQGYGRGDGDSEEDLGRFLNNLRAIVQPIIRAGCKRAVDGVRVVVDFAPGKGEGLTNAKYSPGEDRMLVYGLGLAGNLTGTAGTVAHELGHRYWFKEMSGQARAHWDEVLTNNGVKVTLDDLDEFFQFMLKQVRDGIAPDHAELKSLIARLPASEAKKAVFRVLADMNPYVGDGPGFKPDAYRRGLDRYLGDVVLIEEISEYAASGGPVEAFAEVFRIYCTKGPGRLGPMTLDLFKKVVSSGGVKLSTFHHTPMCAPLKASTSAGPGTSTPVKRAYP